MYWPIQLRCYNIYSYNNFINYPYKSKITGSNLLAISYAWSCWAFQALQYPWSSIMDKLSIMHLMHCATLIISQLLQMNQHVIDSLHVLMHILDFINYGVQFIAPNLIVNVQPFVKYSLLTMDWTSWWHWVNLVKNMI